MRRDLRRRTRRRRLVWPRVLLGLAVLGAVGAVGVHALHAGTKQPPVIRSNPSRARTPSSKAQVAPRPSAIRRPSPLPSSYLLQVAAQSQFSQLPNGCEVTTLSMLLSAVGHPVSKITLAQEMPKDPTPLQLASTTAANGKFVHKVVYWGNPNVGFVGSVYRAGYGYGIYHGPMIRLLNEVLPGRAEDLTGRPFADILSHVAQGIPVEVWTTLTFQPTTNWVTWNSPEGPVHATPLEHAVLIVGYNPQNILINNPWTGQADESVARGPFIAAWKQLGQQAITVKSVG